MTDSGELGPLDLQIQYEEKIGIDSILNTVQSGSSDSMVISFSNQKSRLANAYGNFRSLQTRKLVA